MCICVTCLKIEPFFGSQKLVNSKGTWDEIWGTMKEKLHIGTVILRKFLAFYDDEWEEVGRRGSNKVDNN